eukprot:112134_1
MSDNIMSTCSFTNLNNIDHKEQLIVFGYIHQAQTVLHSDSPIHIIPSLVTHVVLYYYHIPECFEHFASGLQCISMSDDRMIFSKTKESILLTFYGSSVISSQSKSIHEWKFEIIDCRENICIGIDEAIYKFKDSDFAGQSKTANYAYYSGGAKYWNCYLEYTPYGQSFRAGDIVTMILNLNEGCLIFAVNNEDQGVCFDNIIIGDRLSYCMAVSVCSTDCASVKLLCHSMKESWLENMFEN